MDRGLVPPEKYFRPQRARELQQRADYLERWLRFLDTRLHPACVLAGLCAGATFPLAVALLVPKAWFSWVALLGALPGLGALIAAVKLASDIPDCRRDARILEAEHESRHGGPSAAASEAAQPPRTGEL